MCKGVVIDDLLAGQASPSNIVRESAATSEDAVFRVFVGDGHNDLCPAARLTPNDVVLCRKGFELEKKIAAHPVDATVNYWETYEELEALVQGMLPAAASADA